MIAPRSLCAATLLAATASVLLAGAAHAATQSESPHHHHHHKAEGKAGAGTAQSKKVAAHHHKSPATEKAAKPHGAKHPVAKKDDAHEEKPHHKAHTAKHAHHPESTGAAPGHPVAVPLPEDGAPAGSDNGPDGAAQPAVPDAPKGTNTGLPLPRFASLRADKVNMRAGPGERYPIQWVYHRRGLPVQIEREFDVWRLVEDADGVKGWVHQATLAGARDFVVPSPAGVAPVTASSAPAPAAKTAAGGTDADQQAARHTESQVIGHIATISDAAGIPGAVILRASGDNDAAPVAVLEPGTVGTIKTCASGTTWCRVSVRQYDGWLKRGSIWGLSADEALPPS